MSNLIELPGAFASSLADFAEAMPDPVIVTTAGLKIVAINRAARHVLPQLRLGAALPLVIRAPDILEAAARVAGGGAAEKTVWRERVPMEQVMDVHVSPVAAGTGVCVAIVLRDVTDAVRVERMRSDFVANASHELRTPLASMLGFIETLQGPAKNDVAARDNFLGIMREQGRRMARLLDDLLHLSRIEQTQHVQPSETVDLAGAVRHVADTLSNAAAEAGVALNIEAPAVLNVPGARDELIRVAENLIENAIKYGAEARSGPARIDIVLRVDGHNALFNVRDYGPGIASDHLPRLTERFYRVDAPASRAKGGTGLGLAIVKHIVVRHRGELTIASTPGEGAEFRVKLPLGNKNSI